MGLRSVVAVSGDVQDVHDFVFTRMSKYLLLPACLADHAPASVVLSAWNLSWVNVAVKPVASISTHLGYALLQPRDADVDAESWYNWFYETASKENDLLFSLKLGATFSGGNDYGNLMWSGEEWDGGQVAYTWNNNYSGSVACAVSGCSSWCDFAFPAGDFPWDFKSTVPEKIFCKEHQLEEVVWLSCPPNKI